MLFFQKKVGETPLQMLDRLRLEKPEFKDSKLSYIGRLDPMASGEILVLVDEENKDYKKHLGSDKEYEATFLFGLKTDTGDVLGLIERTSDNLNFSKEVIEKNLESFKEIKKQKYPWFSSMVVDGLKLFDHFKKGNLNIERPSREISVKNIRDVTFDNITFEELKDYVFNNISKIEGDFRQKEILEKWQDYFDKKTFSKNDLDEFMTVKIKVLVSTGTYIRGLTENFEYPATLLKLHRTKIVV